MEASSSRSSRKSRGTIRLEDLAFQEHDSVFRAPSGGDWIMLGLVAVGLIGTGLYDWLHLGIDDHTGRAAFFGLLLVAIFWAALVYIFKLSMCVLVGPRGISLVRGPWRTELFWRDTSRLVERTESDSGQRFRWVVAMARDGRELRVREDMVLNYLRFRAEVYERYLLWRDHGGTWGFSGSGPFKATDVIANTVVWWLFGAAIILLPGLYFWILLPETGLTGPILVGLSALCSLGAITTFLGRQAYTVNTKEITCKRPLRPATHLHWRNVSRIDRTRHPAGGLIRVGIALGRLLVNIAARTDSRFKSFAWSPRVPEYLTLRGEGRQVRIRLHRLTRADEMLAWVEYYERIGRRGESPSRPVAPTQPAASSRPAARTLSTPFGESQGGASVAAAASGSGPADPWADGLQGDLPADAYPTELQPAVGANRPPATPSRTNLSANMPPSVAEAFAGDAGTEDERPEGDSWLWDTNKMPRVTGTSRQSNIFSGPAGKSQRPDPIPPPPPPTPSFTPPPTAGPAFRPQAGGGAPSEPAWWLTKDDEPAPSAPSSWDPAASWEPADVYPPVNYPGDPNPPQTPEFSPAYPPLGADQQQDYAQQDYAQQDYAQQDYAQQDDYPPLASPPFVQRPDSQPIYSEPPEEQGPSEHGMYDENLAQSQQWRKQQNWQPPRLPRFGPTPEDDNSQR